MSDTDVPDPAAQGWKAREFKGFFGLLGPLWSRKEDGGWAYGFVTEARHTNAAGVVHGGMLVALLDQALSLTAWEANERKPSVTITLDTHFMTAVMPGQFVEARARIVKRTRSLTFVQGGLYIAGEEVASATAVMKVIEPRG